MEEKKITEITKPIEQLHLYGYEKYFNIFYNLYLKRKLPNSVILTGQKGLGKATFAYHFINYLLSLNEESNYNKDNFTIDKNNSTYKFINNKTHSNLFILDALNEESIKIEQIRKLLLFLNKSTYYKGLKIVLLDNAEYLNRSSSNALLKSIEEPDSNTYFFIINNDSQTISKTIKSRCIDFKITLTFQEKKSIFNKITKNYDLDFSESDLENFLYFDTHGNLLTYLLTLKTSSYKISENSLSCLSYFIEIYKQKNDPKILNFISTFVHNFYNQLSLKNSIFINKYHRNLDKILFLIDNMKKYHLDKKNFIFSIDRIIKNEK
tara:strand:+ start:123 stop:1088 length:966 start_codon:yes stop_codon:yes gene_type:complete